METKDRVDEILKYMFDCGVQFSEDSMSGNSENSQENLSYAKKQLADHISQNYITLEEARKRCGSGIVWLRNEGQCKHCGCYYLIRKRETIEGLQKTVDTLMLLKGKLEAMLKND